MFTLLPKVLEINLSTDFTLLLYNERDHKFGMRQAKPSRSQLPKVPPFPSG